jgi:hypothetical protein
MSDGRLAVHVQDLPGDKAGAGGGREVTRYDKLASYYLAFVQLASTMVWLRNLARV